jgi:hypothetical protein
VNDNPVPIVSAAGPIAFCEGGSVDLTSTPGASYLWSTGDTTQSINISQTDSGVFVKVTNINGCSANSSLLDVIVFPNPDRPQITASGPLCTGSTITLSSDQTTDISWNTGETSADISVSGPGTYTVLYIDSNGCSGEGSFEVLQSTTPATPNLGGPFSVCGGTVDLDAGSYFDPVTYVWSTGETTQTITVSSTNNYSVLVSTPEGCTAEAFAEVSILSPPDATITNSNGSNPLCSGASITLSVSSQPGATYSWSNGASTSTTVITAGGNYSVTVTGSNGCSSSNSTSVNEISCVPATQLRVQDCGYLAFNLSSSIIADLVSGATQYQFEFSNAAGTTVLATVSNATRTLALSSVSPAIQWNTQYSVRVRAFTGTIPGPFGAACIIGTIPDPNSTVPTTQLRSLDCGSTSLSLTFRLTL